MIVRVALNADDFVQLLAGRVVRSVAPASGQQIEIILSDIGWVRMLAAIDEAVPLRVRDMMARGGDRARSDLAREDNSGA